ncbi:MAG: hypothetical protein KC731_07500, partial [Myxococcales bacterium]|nr:hypothetical protein [Myxococcales bacterium]
LFMSMGAVLHRVHTVNGSELGGLYKSMPWTTAFCIVGAASISAFPLFSAFVTKSMILAAVAEEHHTFAFLVLLFASAGVFHHSGIKIPYFAFFAHDSGKRCEEAPRNMLVAMGILAVLCVGIGTWYQPLYALLPHPEILGPGGWTPYDVTHVVTQLQLLLFSFGAFVFLQKTGLYPPELRSVNLDADVLSKKVVPGVGSSLWALWDRGIATVRDVAYGLTTTGVRVIRALHSPGAGVFGEPWSTGRTALWAALLLVVGLVAYYF